MEIAHACVLHFLTVFHKSVFHLPAVSQHIVLTTCSNRKRIPPDSKLLGRVVIAGKPSDVGSAWGKALRQSKSVASAKELYAGRSFREAEQAADLLGARFYIVSAGLGLVAAERKVPSYGLTIAQTSEDCVLDKISGGPADWWAVLKASSMYHEDFPPARGLILAALSQPYLEMIGGDLSSWDAERRSKLRLFTKQDPSVLFPRLADQWMPYDDRLDFVSRDLAGTQSDFAQRALRHFAASIISEPGSADTHAKRVKAALYGLEMRAQPSRKRLSDDEILKVIDAHWDKAKGQSGLMLRVLRDDLNLACEQGRFKHLFHAAKIIRKDLA